MMDESGKVVFKAFPSPIPRTADMPSFPNLLLILPAPTTLKSVWKLPGTTGSLSTRFFLKRSSFSMSSIRFRRTAGVGGQRSASAKMISLILSLETRLADEDLFSLRSLTRFRTYLVESISDLKRKVVCVLDQVFLNTSPFFRHIWQDLKRDPSPVFFAH